MPYNFGFPDTLVGIHFPAGGYQPPDAPIASYPWYWWIGPPARPYYFQFEAAPYWGNGWQRTQAYPQIRILPIDTQGPPKPSTNEGYTTLENAIDNGGPDVAFGRFKFQDNFFWKVMGVKKPEFFVREGRPEQTQAQLRNPKTKPIDKVIGQTVKSWNTKWNFGAKTFNGNAAAGALVRPTAQYVFPSTQFALPLPTDPTVAGLLFNPTKFYLGPVPGGFWFNGGTVQIYKQAYSFSMNVGQLSLQRWNQSVFPPTRNPSGFKTFDCSGYGQTDFPLSGPQIVGV